VQYCAENPKVTKYIPVFSFRHNLGLSTGFVFLNSLRASFRFFIFNKKTPDIHSPTTGFRIKEVVFKFLHCGSIYAKIQT